MVDTLLKEMRLDATAFDAESLIDLFIAEMEQGLAGEPSSLPMIPAYIAINGSVPYHEPVIVVDAGGTNLRVCLLQFDDIGAPQVSHFRKIPMIGTQGEVSADEFFSQLANLIAPVADKAARIGFCFSYPAEILPDLDGRLLYWSKEVRVPELVGQCLAKGLSLELKGRGLGEKKIVVLNDTVACLLAGRAEGEKKGSDSFIGFILGTGTNTAYIEKNSHILKLDRLDPLGAQVINVESGGFSGCVRGVLDLKLDEQSDNPGEHVFEKMLSGVYLGKLALELIRTAAERSIFSESTAAMVLALTDLPWIEVNTFMYEPNATRFSSCPQSDRVLLQSLFCGIVDRAALLTAVNMSAAAIKSGAGHSPAHPICINVDGSTYYKTWQLADKVQDHLAHILNARGIHYVCVQVDDSPMVGAAIAGLTAF